MVYMANQIGRFFRHQAEEKAIANIADHLVKFWDPRMRAAIFSYVDGGGTELQPLVLKAVFTIKKDLKAAQI
jgi:formate dehydrogenase subunit delta